LKKIELFGLPCSGKTFLRTILRNKLERKNLIIHNYSSAFFEHIFYEKNISFVERLSLNYFKYLKYRKISSPTKFIKNDSNKKKNNKKIFIFKNFISEFFYNNYIDLCKRYQKKVDDALKKVIFKKINQKEKEINNKKRNVKLWFTEYFAHKYITDKYSHKIDILIDDESIYQKIFVFSDMSFDNRFIKKYFKSLDNVDLLIQVCTSKDLIFKRSNKRFGSKKFYYNNENELNKMIKYQKKILPTVSNKMKFLIFKNSSNYLKKINKIYEMILKNYVN
jgi:hypothetical protein